MIRADGPRGPWFLQSGGSQTVLALAGGGWPVLVQWGQPINHGDEDRLETAPNGYSVFGEDSSYTPNRLAFEYPGGQNGDFRSPAYVVDSPGGQALDLKFVHAEVLPGMPDRGGLPGARSRPGETGLATLVLTLGDPVTGLMVELRCSPVDQALVRSVRFVNRGPAPLTIRRALSFNVDLHPDRDSHIVALDGA